MRAARAIAFIGAAMFAAPGSALAQAPNSVYTSGAHPPVSPEEAGKTAESAQTSAFPLIYVIDSHGLLAKIRMGPFFVTRFVRYTQAQLTDIAFDPVSHKLYGLSFTSLFSINIHTARATLIGDLGVTDANALAFNAAGEAYSAGYQSGKLYKIDLSTAKAAVVGRMSGYRSAGALAFYNGRLVLSAFKGADPIGPATKVSLVDIDKTTGAALGPPSPIQTRELFALVSTGPDALYGIGLGVTPYSTLVKLFPDASPGRRDRAVYRLPSGVKRVYGVAYDGAY